MPDSKIARIGDRTHGICYHSSHNSPISVGGTIITGASNCYCEDKKIARVGDRVMTDCGHIGTIVTGAEGVIVENMRCATVGDLVRGVYKATIITGASN